MKSAALLACLVLVHHEVAAYFFSKIVPELAGKESGITLITTPSVSSQLAAISLSHGLRPRLDSDHGSGINLYYSS
ncbi:MAG: hypothetical protein DME69_02490 [Verrucomicrobia bacterium]|nr:MAG: hypothetical protein DME69_02490 [Verrucomicrobiota bacterium]